LVIVCGGILAACQEKKPVVEDNKAFMLSDTMMKRIELASVVTEPVRSELTLVGKVIADETRVIKGFPLGVGKVKKPFHGQRPLFNQRNGKTRADESVFR